MSRASYIVISSGIQEVNFIDDSRFDRKDDDRHGLPGCPDFLTDIETGFLRQMNIKDDEVVVVRSSCV